jgi:hypothetical protein
MAFLDGRRCIKKTVFTGMTFPIIYQPAGKRKLAD